ncbi:potassium-transporting ATPase subunit KdpA [Tuwongella immobilis]|uniref:Potassium-transporting ATPase potassium-binding subunit n=1 Tax=Tuwongella immobilis TaxID=692036 RepID=A0A6C2YRH0_9BACT|nr:potassium-transporting ATPase subunit KdpA [Tuwongella immobilis]VIP04260.1 potassium abc transporter atpase : Potassium-transporting ATPase A chain OS=Burkholderia sp. MSh2 GN=kdpA PE=3 SV=1: KdpA [Tuwongella immobilis]VTS05883.1 potassium abc transporter atpase : Potassium-transporting ATPase A chain OS=Burkholderia sp. MSh2 GN=kdpA PE=3 SV=1: KdpA [Tuwongella immobilis]
MWWFPVVIVGISTGLAIPLGRRMARILDRPASNRLERWLDSGPQAWKPYVLAMLSFNVAVFVLGFLILACQPLLPLNPDGKGMLAPSTVFNTAASFLTNTNLQHYSGEVHLSHFSQLGFIAWKQFVTPAIGLAALLAVIRGLRGDPHLGNFYLDLWRGVVGVFLPLALIVGLLLIAGGVPMTLDGAETVTTLEGGSQTISRGPVAAVVAIKQLGTNGGGYFGTNSAHPLENPTAWTNMLECICILLVPMACVVMYGRMLSQPTSTPSATTASASTIDRPRERVGSMREATVIFGVMLLFLGVFLAWGIVTDSLAPNPGLRGLPIDSSSGNLEGKELRFGPVAGPVWAACTTATSNGSVNCMHDSLNPLAGLTPLAGMWLNCIFGGVGVGLINFLVMLVVAVFLAGLMVGRTPEYLGKKVEAREMKLAMLALLIHPLMILAPTGIAAISDWGVGATNNPGPHGLTEMLYEFTSASANNGSGFEGLADTVGTAADAANPEKADAVRRAMVWDITTGIIMLLCRFVPIIAPIALAASLASKKRTPVTVGTLRTDTLTFAGVLIGTIVLIGALLFLPVAALGPIAEQLQWEMQS